MSSDGTNQMTLAGEIREDNDPDTSEDYKFSRPQCVAATAAGDRCSNPVRRTDGDAEFCPRHYDAEDVERYVEAATDRSDAAE